MSGNAGQTMSAKPAGEKSAASSQEKAAAATVSPAQIVEQSTTLAAPAAPPAPEPSPEPAAPAKLAPVAKPLAAPAVAATSLPPLRGLTPYSIDLKSNPTDLVVAHSEYEAEALYKRFYGIVTTEHEIKHSQMDPATTVFAKDKGPIALVRGAVVRLAVDAAGLPVWPE